MGAAAWFMVIIFTNGNGSAIDHIRFESEESCIAASKVIGDREGMLSTVFIRCVRNH